MDKHICLGNIKKLYKSSGKCDYKQHYKAILEAAMVYIPEGFTDNIPISPSQYANLVQKTTPSVFISIGTQN